MSENDVPWPTGMSDQDPAARDRPLYFRYARDGCSALWVRVPDDADADRAVRCLADHQVFHIRHYGHGSQRDIHIR